MRPPIEEIRERAEKAAPGPWTKDDLTDEVLEDHEAHYWENCPHGCEDEDCVGHHEERAFEVTGIRHVPSDGEDGWWFHEHDADFIIHAREDVPAMLAYIKELEEKAR